MGTTQPTGRVLKSDDVRHRECRRGSVDTKKLAGWLALLICLLFAAAAPARAETRSLKLYFLHTGERAEITYKRNGRYLQSGLNQINHLLRDWRRNEPTKMDPRLLDLLWAVYQASGSREYIHVVSAYRSPATNAMLRSRSSGVAEKSQHMLGKACDFFLPDVKLSKLRAIAMKMQVGGVGYYPHSGSPFVHLDVGSVRHWPRMSRRELATLFPDGKTLYIPSDGKPMPGYKQALAAYQARQRSGESIQIASDGERTRGRGILAALFGGGADEAEDNADIQVAAAQQTRTTPRPVAQPAQTQAPQPQPVQPEQPDEAGSPATLIAALPARAVPVPRAAPRPSAEVGAGSVPAAAEMPAQTASQEPAQAGQLQEVLQTALVDVPLPTSRPEHVPAIGLAQQEASEESPPTVAAFVTPSPRPDRPAASDAIAELLMAQKDQDQDQTAQTIASAYRPGSGDKLQTAAPDAPAAAELQKDAPIIDRMAQPAVASAGALPEAAIAALRRTALEKANGAAAASPRMALLENRNVSPAALISGGVKTTPKGPRPGPEDVPPEPEPKVLPVQAVMAELMLSRESVLERRPVAKAPSFTIELAEAPREVYTDGFKQDVDVAVADARRFTGKAVTFLSIAKFDGN